MGQEQDRAIGSIDLGSAPRRVTPNPQSPQIAKPSSTINPWQNGSCDQASLEVFDMRIYNNPAVPCHQLSRQLQFDLRLVTVAPVTKAGHHIRHRFGVRPELADLIANLAGLGINGEAR
jgi:hypothetical protein